MSLLSGVIRNQGATEANPVEKAQSCEKRQKGQKRRQKDAESCVDLRESNFGVLRVTPQGSLLGPLGDVARDPKGDALGVTHKNFIGPAL